MLTADVGARTLDCGWRPARAAAIVGTGRVGSRTAKLPRHSGIQGRWLHVDVLVIVGRRPRRATTQFGVRAVGSAR